MNNPDSCFNLIQFLIPVPPIGNSGQNINCMVEE